MKVREKNFRGVHESTIAYDRIGSDAAYFLSHSVVAKFGTILFLTVSVCIGAARLMYGIGDQGAWLFYLAVAVLTYIYYENTKQQGYRLQCDFGSLVVVGRRDDVEPFLHELSKRKMNFVRDSAQRRLTVVERPEVERYLLALRDGSVLTPGQYEDIRKEAGLERSDHDRVGFAV